MLCRICLAETLSPETINVLKELIGSMGFPIVVTGILLWDKLVSQKKVAEQMSKLSQTVEVLSKQLAEIVVNLAKKEK